MPSYGIIPGKERSVYPFCIAECPINNDAQEYVSLIAHGRFEAAYELIKKKNPLPSVCGRICSHPCETNCRRAAVDDPIAVHALKRFVADRFHKSGKSSIKKLPLTKKRRVAVVGGGPTGLVAAHDLVRMGYPVTVFESKKLAGGVLQYGIPQYRLEKDVLQSEIADIVSLGVEIRTQSVLGRDFSLTDLRNDFDAVLLATGLQLSRYLSLKGRDAEGVLLALPFLESVNSGKPMPLGKNVLVIGGGNVAVDVARSAVRCGVEKVKIMCLESRPEMPAFEWEVNDAVAEGVELICSWGPGEILTRDGRVCGMLANAVKNVFDEDGRFAPEFFEDKVREVICDTVVFAIGQETDEVYIEKLGLETDEKGRIKCDPVSGSTSERSVFIAGELATGLATTVDAMHSGQVAARRIDSYLSGTTLAEPGQKKITGELSGTVAEKICACQRVKIPVTPVHGRVNGFEPVEGVLDEFSAVTEAQRCLNCASGAECRTDKCCTCLTCVAVCPFDAPRIVGGDEIFIDPDRCQACGLCYVECPAGAIEMAQFSSADLAESIRAELIGISKKPVVAFVSAYAAYVPDNGGYKRFEFPENVLPVSMISTGRLSPADILHAFEAGAGGVVVIGCAREEERFQDVRPRVENHVRLVRKLLGEIGHSADEVQYRFLVERDNSEMNDVFKDALNGIYLKEDCE